MAMMRKKNRIHNQYDNSNDNDNFHYDDKETEK